MYPSLDNTGQTGINPPCGRRDHAGAALPEKENMAVFNDKVDDRLSAQAKAKQAMLDKFKAKPAADDPAVLARQAERREIVAAREARASQRQAEKEAEAARLAAEQAVRESELAAEREAQRLRELDAAAEAKRVAAEQKAARDARYAKRKAKR